MRSEMELIRGLLAVGLMSTRGGQVDPAEVDMLIEVIRADERAKVAEMYAPGGSRYWRPETAVVAQERDEATLRAEEAERRISWALADLANPALGAGQKLARIRRSLDSTGPTPDPTPPAEPDDDPELAEARRKYLVAKPVSSVDLADKAREVAVASAIARNSAADVPTRAALRQVEALARIVSTLAERVEGPS